MLEKLKDIFYDKNDMIVALALVIIGAFIISHQVDAIMSYPEQLAEQLQQEQLEQQEQEQQEQQGGSAKPGGEEIDPSGESQGDVTGTETSDPQTPDVQEPEVQDPEPQTQTPSTSTEFKTAVERTVEIPSGAYSQKIAQILSDAGVVPSQEAFLKAVNDAGLETKLKAGTFKIPAGSTLDDVVKIVTK